MKCLQCGLPGGWLCPACTQEHGRLYLEVSQMSRLLGENESESPLVFSAARVLEAYERVENTTSLGKAQVMARARELLMEVEDHFKYTPICPMCKTHKMELVPGDPIKASCTGGCEL